MHYDLIIISNLDLKNEIFENINYLILDDSHYLINPHLTNTNINFDYLIFSNIDSVKNLDLLTDNNFIITNSYFQTNLDHIFAIGKINNSQKSIDQQLVDIKDFLMGT